MHNNFVRNSTIGDKFNKSDEKSLKEVIVRQRSLKIIYPADIEIQFGFEICIGNKTSWIPVYWYFKNIIWHYANYADSRYAQYV